MPESTPGSWARNGGRPWERVCVQQPVGAPLGDRANLRHGDGQEVAGEGHRGPVEVPARLDLSVRENHGIVDRRTQLRGGYALGVLERVPGGPDDLRRAAQRIGVLNARIALAVAGDDLGAAQQRRRFAALADLTGLRTQPDEVGREGTVGAEQRLDGHRRGHVRHPRATASGPRTPAPASPSIPSVPLISASPSFAPKAIGSIPASARPTMRRA